ncbi:MAG: DUF2089 domain-containing protein, partial [Chloroflexi bacterium]|nr:DUF2089 domain-containing protein [Chloroflexota bacterium]
HNVLLRTPMNTFLTVNSIAGNLRAQDLNESLQVQTMVGGDCTIQRVAAVEIGELVGADLRLRYVPGESRISEVKGDCTVRRVGSLSIEAVNGNCRLRHVSGDIMLGTVHGDFSLRDAERPVQVTRVNGSLLCRNVPYGIRAEQVDGQLALRTHFAAEAVYQFSLNGNASFHIPEDANVRFIIERVGGRMMVDNEPFTPAKDGETELSFGTGSATVRLSTNGNVRIVTRLDEEEESLEFNFDMLANDIFTATMEAISSAEGVAERLSGLPDRIRSRVERKLTTARRRVEAAQRDVDRAMEDVELSFSPAQGVSSTSQQGGASEGERLMILQMLESGKISVDEAERLLSALE